MQDTLKKRNSRTGIRISDKEAGLILTVLNFVLKLKSLFCLCEDEINEKELIRLRKKFRNYGERLPVFETNKN